MRAVTAMESNAAGVRVLEWPGGGIAAAYAGWLLARRGATVTRLTASAVEALHDTSPEALALEVLADGKSTLPVPSSAAALDVLLGDCDILLCDAPAALTACAASPAGLSARHTQLIVGITTTFGLDGPLAGHAGTGLDAQALSATAWALGEPGRAPLTLPPGIVEHQAGAMLAAGCLLALNVRDAATAGEDANLKTYADAADACASTHHGRGRGRVVDIALADVLASYIAGNCRFYVHHGLQWQRSGHRASGSGGAYPFLIAPCKDGAVCICGRTREEWQRLVAVMGNPEWAAQPRYQDLRAMGTQYPDEVDLLVKPWFAARTKAELEAIALEHNLIVAPLRTMDEVLATPHFAARGFFAKGRAAGRAVTVPSLPFRVSEVRAQDAPNIAAGLLTGSARPANNRAQPDTAPRTAPDSVTASSSTSTSAAATATASTTSDSISAPQPRPGISDTQPLKGLRVLDLGWVWSAPWVSTMLGELGAEVIKVEHAKRPDNLRLSGRVVRDGKVVEGPHREMSPMYHQVNHGKLGITLNTKEPRAVALVKRLAAMSDIVIENMSPGSMERSGLGFETLRAINPRLVMLAMSSAGQFGELASMRAYAPTMSSFVGMEELVGYPGEAAQGALNIALGDPNAAVHGLVAVLAALRHARSSGTGCYIDLSQNEALLGTLRPYLLDAQVQGQQPLPTGNRHPSMAPHGIYPAREADAWLTLTVANDAQWQALTQLAPTQAWAQDARWQHAAARCAGVAELDAAIGAWSAAFARDELVTRLRGAGLAATPVLSLEEQREHPQFAARGMRHPIQIPVYGADSVFCAPWRFTGFAPQVSTCGPTTGQHNDQVFRELLGLSPDEISELKQSGVIA